MMTFDREAAKRRIAELGQLKGPVLLERCGEDGGFGALYYLPRTARIGKHIAGLKRRYKETWLYRELILRAVHADGERVWDDEEVEDVLKGGIDPTDAAYLWTKMYTESIDEAGDENVSRFSKDACASKFAEYDRIMGPVFIPGLGEAGADLPVFYRPKNGLRDSAAVATQANSPDDYQVRLLVAEALRKDGTRMFDGSDFEILMKALTEEEVEKVIGAMIHPRIMSEERKLEMQLAAEQLGMVPGTPKEQQQALDEYGEMVKE